MLSSSHKFYPSEDVPSGLAAHPLHPLSNVSECALLVSGLCRGNRGPAKDIVGMLNYLVQQKKTEDVIITIHICTLTAWQHSHTF